MTTLTPDTSGEVLAQRASSGGPFAFHWSDLDPFTQGYVEALLRALGEVVIRRNHMEERDEFDRAAFSDLAPETLAAILKDCGAFLEAYPQRRDGDPIRQGALFWKDRQEPDGFLGFPPLTASLGDDGKVRLS